MNKKERKWKIKLKKHRLSSLPFSTTSLLLLKGLVQTLPKRPRRDEDLEHETRNSLPLTLQELRLRSQELLRQEAAGWGGMEEVTRVRVVA